MDKLPVMVLLLAASMLLFGCPGPGPAPAPNVTNNTNVTPAQNFTCPDGTVVPDPSKCEANYCPFSCEDGNPCTIDKCGKDTGYECTHIAKIPCCGDGVCESGENKDSCLQDCGSCPPDCEDENACTLDYCSQATGFNCTHEKKSGNMLGCAGYTGFLGYSNTNYQYGLTPPPGWALDEESKKSEEGVLFLGPDTKQNCSEEVVFEAGVYADLSRGFIIYPVADRPEVNGSFEGQVFKTSNKTTDPSSLVYVLLAPTSYKETAYLDKVKQELASASSKKSEIKLLGATMVNITVSWQTKKTDEGTWYTATIVGFSNRTGKWGREVQKHNYTIYQGRTYMYGFIETQQNRALPLFKLNPWPGCSKEPYKPSIGIYQIPTNPAYLIGDYARDSISKASKELGYVPLESDDALLDGNAAKYYVMSFVDKGYPVKRKAIVSYRRGKAYRVEYTSLRGFYEQDYPAFDYVARSFKMLAPPDNCRKQTCVDGACAIQAIQGCCGNGFCEAGEACFSCPQDCGVCSSTYRPLDAELSYRAGDSKHYSSFNCENYQVRIQIYNPLDEPMTVYAEGALRLKTDADSTCRAPARSSIDCIATMSGAFGDAYAKDTVEKAITVFGYGGIEMEKGEIIYAKTIRFNVTYDISWVGPYCLHFYCVPGLNKTFMGTTYAITGIEEYRGDILAGNWWCHANMTRLNRNKEIVGIAEIYFNKFYNKTCTVSYTPTMGKLSEKCYNLN